MALSFLPLLGHSAAAPSSDIPALAAHLPRGVDIHIQRDIDAPAETVWALLAHDYVGIDAWEQRIRASRPMTTDDLPENVSAHPDAPVVGRVVKTGLGELIETLVDYDDAGRTFTFHAAGLPPLIRYAQNRHTVLDLGEGRCRVTFDIYMVPHWAVPNALLARRFGKGLATTLEDLAVAVEGA